MNFYELSEYKNLETELKRCIDLNVNLLIVTMVGYSAPYYTKKFVEKKPKDVAYITSSNETLSKFNLLDFDFANKEEALKIAEDYVRSASTSQKFGLIINTPHILESDEFKKSYIGTHFYSIYKFTKPSFASLREYADSMKVNLAKDELAKLYVLAGGIGRLTKYLLANPKLIQESADNLAKNKYISLLIRPIVESISKCPESVLEEFGVKEGGKYSSKIISAYFEIHPKDSPLAFELTNENQLIENGVEGEKLNRVEANIIKYLLTNRGLVEKEKIADMKWGQGSYDQYSDQAIVKTVRRLNKKLKSYKFITISGIGYKLVEK